VIPTLPRHLRDRLATAILAGFHDSLARRELELLARGDDAALAAWLPPGETGRAGVLRLRARAAVAALADRPSGGPVAAVQEALAAAAALFDRHLYFEVHELLEPFWVAASGETREALQGLIQVAVGYQHLANDNLAGARDLLLEGARRLEGRTVDGLRADDFARAVRQARDRLPAVDWGRVPPFPGPPLPSR
jgi:hypothetical protein